MNEDQRGQVKNLRWFRPFHKKTSGVGIVLESQKFQSRFAENKFSPHTSVANFYHCTADNIGDLMCGPVQYLWPEIARILPMTPINEQIEQDIIIGGGQLFSQMSLILASIYKSNPKARVIAWGIGLPPAGVRDRRVREVAQEFALFGTRNYDRRDHLPFVPCASCLSSLFDHVSPPNHEVVFYLHRRKGAPVDVPAEIPVLTNAKRPPKEVIDFIASGETIVTSSYHGVYWAQLLGRRVICLPYNNKFDTFQYLPTMAEANDWQSRLVDAFQRPSLLEEYRALNHAFAQQVLEIWNG